MTMPLALFDLSMRAASETNANTARNLTANYSPRGISRNFRSLY